jgi:hypothetical protein
VTSSEYDMCKTQQSGGDGRLRVSMQSNMKPVRRLCHNGGGNDDLYLAMIGREAESVEWQQAMISCISRNSEIGKKTRTFGPPGCWAEIDVVASCRMARNVNCANQRI